MFPGVPGREAPPRALLTAARAARCIPACSSPSCSMRRALAAATVAGADAHLSGYFFFPGGVGEGYPAVSGKTRRQPGPGFQLIATDAKSWPASVVNRDTPRRVDIPICSLFRSVARWTQVSGMSSLRKNSMNTNWTSLRNRSEAITIMASRP